MDIYQKSTFFIFLIFMCCHGLCELSFGAMESELSRDTRSKRLKHRVSEIAVSQTHLPVHISPRSSEYRRGMDLIHAVTRGDETESALCDRLSKLSLTEQCEIIRTAEQAGFDWMLGTACSTCAEALSSDKNLQLLLEDPEAVHCLLYATHRVTNLIRPFLQSRVETLLTRISSASYRDTIRLYSPAIESDKRFDVFMMPTNTVHDIIYVMRDYKGDYCDRRSLGPITPLIMGSESVQNITIIDQEKIAQAVSQLTDCQTRGFFCSFLNGLTYKSNHDGSLIVALTGSGDHESDVLVVMRRIQGNTVTVTKVLHLPSPVLTCPCVLSRRVVKQVPLLSMSYDMNASFMIRPYSHIVSYIDVNHNLYILDLDSTRSARVTTGGTISALSWSPNGKILAYASRGGVLNFNYCSSGPCASCFRYDNEIRKIQWSIDGTKILLMFDTSVKLINSTDGSEIATYTLPNKIIQATLSDDASKLLIGCTNQTTYLFDADTATCRHICKIDHADITSLMISPDNQYVFISCVQYGAMRTYVWNTENLRLEFYPGSTGMSYSFIARKMQQGRPDFHNLTMAQLVLLMAAEQLGDQRKFTVAESHPFYQHIGRCVPILRKYIMSKLLVQ